MIPPKGSGRRTKYSEVTRKISKLGIGEKVVVPFSYYTRVYRSARSFGYEVTVRRLGSEDKITVWRTS